MVVDANKRNIRININDGALKGLSLSIVVPSGTITYSETKWTVEDVIATLHLNGTRMMHTFKENGEYQFKYTDTNGEAKTAIAKVENIDKVSPEVTIKEEYLIAGDVTEDNEVDFKDIVKLNKYRLKKILQILK